MNNKPHTPVLLQKAKEYLSPKKGDRYLDLTAGFGGHAFSIAELVGEKGKLTLVDRDAEAVKYLENLFAADKRVKIVQNDFYSASSNLLAKGEKFDCILADIGVSSYQLDDSSRGFSFDKEGPLDMRMDKRQKTSAFDVVNSYDIEQLKKIFVMYGELTRKQASLLSERIAENRPIHTTSKLAFIAGSLPRKRGKKIKAQVFQAIRIEVNDELGLLEKSLPVWAKLLAPYGRLAVISFHSLEDRIVKQFFVQRSKNRYEADLSVLNKKPITAKKNERVYNPRARSALLRAAVKK